MTTSAKSSHKKDVEEEAFDAHENTKILARISSREEEEKKNGRFIVRPNSMDARCQFMYLRSLAAAGRIRRVIPTSGREENSTGKKRGKKIDILNNATARGEAT